ncbi:C-C motif chemokine 19-like [Pelodytes ibericus]
MELHPSMIFLVMLSLWVASEVTGSNIIASDCCLTVKNKEIPKRNVKDYIGQDVMSGCSIKAVIFITRRNRRLCAPHDEPWAIKLMQEIDGRRKRKKRHNQCY